MLTLYRQSYLAAEHRRDFRAQFIQTQLPPLADITFADVVSSTVLDDFEGKGYWMLLESPLLSAGKLIMQTKGLSSKYLDRKVYGVSF